MCIILIFNGGIILFKIRYLFFIIIICLLAISTVSANEINSTANLAVNENFNDEISLSDVMVIADDSDEILNTYDENTIGVNKGTFTQLQELINETAAGSTIYLEKDYVYDDGFDSQGIHIHRPLTINGNGHTIDALGKSRIFCIDYKYFAINNIGSNLVLNNIEFCNGNGAYGGAICTYHENDDITSFYYGGNKYNAYIMDIFINNSTFINNSAEMGGAIHEAFPVNCIFINNSAENYGGASVYGDGAVNCIFVNNTAGTDGGAIAYGDGVVNCVFVNNSAEDDGGAIYRASGVVNCSFVNNSADFEGAIYDGDAYNCTFTNNSGGAIYGDAYNCTFINNSGGAMSSGDAYNCTFINNSGGAMSSGDAYNCTFTNNFAEDGGAISDGDAYNCTFTNNFAEYGGGAISYGDAYNCTFTNNFAEDGGAIRYGDAVNCSFVNNSAEDGGAISYGDAVNCSFVNNSANYGGGAIYNGDAYNCTFTNNIVEYYGGAIYNSDAYNCTFTNNSAKYYGGAMYGNNHTAVGCQFIENSAGNGGATSRIIANNCVFTKNRANQYGGAMHDGTAVNCIFNGNIAGEEGNNIFNPKETIISSVYNKATYELVATLNDCDGEFITNAPIYIIIGDKVYSSQTDSNGQIKFSTVGLIPDTYVATVIYSDPYNPIYRYSNTTVNVIVNKLDTILTIPDVITVYNTSGKVVATLKDSLGNVVSGVNVKIVVGSLSKTAKTNKNGRVSMDISSLEPGEYMISANSSATSKIYNEAKATAKVTVNKIDTTLTIPDVVTVYNTSGKVVATLKDSYGNALSGVNVKIVVGDLTKTAKTNKNGRVALDISSLAPGEYKVSARSSGTSDIYKEAKVTAKVTVNKIDTTLTVSDVVTVYGVGGSVVATLTDSFGNAISCVNVKIVVDTLSKTAKTDANGQVSLDISGLAPGEYKISARSSAISDIYKEAKVTAKAIVSADKIDTTLTVPDVVTVYGVGGSVVATLTDSFGNAVSGINVKIVVDTLSKTTKTDANGQVSLDISGLAPGEYKISARSSATSDIYNEAKTTAKAVVYADKLDTTLTVPDVIAVGDSPAFVVATLKDSYGNAVSGVNVKIVVGDLTKTVKTDANGQVSLDISGLAPGEYKISARSSGTSDIYKEAKATAKTIISEDKLDTTLTVPDVVVGGSSSGVVVATLKDSYGNAISGVNVKIVAGSLSKTAKTNSKGKVSLDISSLAPGEYKISARSSGTSDIYKEAKATAKAIVNAN
jgi:predicted outer membrane repeat protein